MWKGVLQARSCCYLTDIGEDERGKFKPKFNSSGVSTAYAIIFRFCLLHKHLFFEGMYTYCTVGYRSTFHSG